MEKRQLLNMLKSAKERACDAEQAVWSAQLNGESSHKISEHGPSHKGGRADVHAEEEQKGAKNSSAGEFPVRNDDECDAPDGEIDIDTLVEAL